MIDTIETLKFPPPPKLPESISSLDDVQALTDKLRKYFNSQSVSYNQLYNVLHEGALVENWQIHNLSVDNLLAGSILTTTLYIGDDHFALNGQLKMLTIDDDQTPRQRRVEIGSFGSGVDYGINIYDEDGNTLFSQTGLGPGVVKNANVATDADIDGSKLLDLSIENAKIADATIAAAKIISLEAEQITTGTLTVDSTAIAIDVTSGGVFLLENGADIIMKAAPSTDISQLKFQDSNGNNRGDVSYYPTLSAFYLESIGTNLIIQATGTSKFIAFDTSDATMYVQTLKDFIPHADNTVKLGRSGMRFSDIYVTTTHIGDVYMANGFCITESTNVYPDAPKGLVFLNDENSPIMILDRDGNMHIVGDVKTKSDIFTQTNVHVDKGKIVEEI